MSRKEEKDIAILRAAEKEFLCKGLEAASMENISKEAGVSKRTLYKYYPTKSQLFNGLLDLIFTQYKETIDYPYDSSKSLEELFTKIVDIKVTVCLDPYTIKLSKLIFSENLKDTEDNTELLEKIESLKEYLYDWFAKAITDGKINANYGPKEVAKFFISLVDGLVLWPLMLGLKKEHTEIEIKAYKKIIVDSFLKTFSNE